jgi:hypothetical protein
LSLFHCIFDVLPSQACAFFLVQCETSLLN